jgi:hypothetical protein
VPCIYYAEVRDKKKTRRAGDSRNPLDNDGAWVYHGNAYNNRCRRGEAAMAQPFKPTKIPDIARGMFTVCVIGYRDGAAHDLISVHIRGHHRFEGGNAMKRYVTWGIVCVLLTGLAACGVTSSHPRTPTAVVQALFTRIQGYKTAEKTALDQGLSVDEAKQARAEAKAAVDSLFLTPEKAQFITVPLMFLDFADVEFLDETIDGSNAEVTIEHSVVGFAQRVQLEEAAQSRTQMTFQLQKQDGRWLISDTGGILQKFGR